MENIQEQRVFYNEFIGLTIGITCTILISLWVKDELFDNFTLINAL
jgi:hypothetical protein